MSGTSRNGHHFDFENPNGEGLLSDSAAEQSLDKVIEDVRQEIQDVFKLDDDKAPEKVKIKTDRVYPTFLKGGIAGKEG